MPSTLDIQNISTESDEFEITEATEQSHDQITDLLVHHFLPEEPLNKSINLMDDPVSLKQFIDSCKRRFSAGVTLVAIEKSSGTLAGTISLMPIYSSKQSKVFQYAPDPNRGFKREMNFRFLKTVHDQYTNAFQILNADHIIDLLTLCVNPNYRGKGLGFRLMSAAVETAKKLGAGAVSCVCTSSYSQTIARKLGFESLSEVKYTDYKYEGKILYDNTGQNTTISVMGKQI